MARNPRPAPLAARHRANRACSSRSSPANAVEPASRATLARTSVGETASPATAEPAGVEAEQPRDDVARQQSPDEDDERHRKRPRTGTVTESQETGRTPTVLPRRREHESKRGEGLQDPDEPPDAARRCSRCAPDDGPVDRPAEVRRERLRLDAAWQGARGPPAGRREAARRPRRGGTSSAGASEPRSRHRVEEGRRVGDSGLAPGPAIDPRRDRAERTGSPGPGAGARRGHGLALGGGQVDERSSSAVTRSIVSRREASSTNGATGDRSDRPRRPRRGRGPWPRSSPPDGLERRASPRPRQRANRATAPSRPARTPVRTQAEPAPAACAGRPDVRPTGHPSEVPSRSLRTRWASSADSRSVLLSTTTWRSSRRQPGREEVVMENGVVILLRIGHPDHGVDARQDRLDPLAMLVIDRVEVRQVEDRDVAEPVLVMVVRRALRDAEPIRAAPSGREAGARDPGHRVRGRRAACRRDR